MTKLVRIDQPSLDNTQALIAQVLPPILKQNARVRFLTPSGEGQPVIQRVRVMLSRSRKNLLAKGKRPRRFRLRSSVHPETHEGQRYDCLILWREVTEGNRMLQDLEGLLIDD